MSEIAQTFRFYKNLNHLEQKGAIMAEYIWIDGSDTTVRSKSRTLRGEIKSIADIPVWNYDGSSCYQASTHNSEVILKPVAYYPDPFRSKEYNILVLCESHVWADSDFKELRPANTNFRHYARKIFEAADHQEPWFGLEQEYSVLEHKNKFTVKPLGWPSSGYPGPQGPYYCSVGATNCYGRSIMDAHYKSCLFAGLKISGTNCETMPGQWEFQIGPVAGIEAGDQLWVARYILMRVAEDFNITITLEPKLFKDFNGAGAHINFSTNIMRSGQQGMDYIYQIIEKLKNQHIMHIQLYGDNSKRLTGNHETSSAEIFTSGVGDRTASVRIPSFTAMNDGLGYIEDRRPASDIDPYVALSAVVDTTVNDGAHIEDLYKAYMEWKEWRKTAEIEEV